MGFFGKFQGFLLKIIHFFFELDQSNPIRDRQNHSTESNNSNKINE